MDLYFEQGGRELTVVQNGVQGNVRLGDTFGVESRDNLLRKLREEQAFVLATVDRQETAYWNPTIVTDAKGTAKLEVSLPERSTTWKLAAHGITAETLVGETDAELTVKKELFGELSLPAVVIDGDSLRIPATIHDLADRKAGDPATKIEASLVVKIGDKRTEERRTISAEKSGLHELTFAATPKLSDRPAADSAATEEVMEVKLTVTSGDRRDVSRRSIPLRPFGYTIASSTSGAAAADATVWLEEPTGMTLERPRMEIVVGANVAAGLLEIVFGADRHCGLNAQFAAPLETATSDLLAVLALQDYLQSTKTDASTAGPQLAARIRATIGQLVAAQLDDGGWSWTGANTAADRFASAAQLVGSERGT
ncbi:MAG: alpha-2-macroglobulin family protein [Pirellulales bacterium]